MTDKINTRDHNIALLIESGFKKYSNTTVFFRNSISLISPAVAKNIAGKYWFDIRKVNLDRLTDEAFLLVRIVPDLFILLPLTKISKLLSKKLMDNRPNSGDVWGIHMKLDTAKGVAKIFNLKESETMVTTKLIFKNDIVGKLSTIG